MKFFLDTANIQEIKKIAEMGLLDGITTNPSLVAKTGRTFHDVATEICQFVQGPVSLEVIAIEAEKMIEEANKLIQYGKNVVIKVPITQEGLKAVKKLSERGIQTNVTLCFSPLQALLAAKAGATYISPFVGRLDDCATNGMELITQIKKIYENYKFRTQIIVASIRHPLHIVESAMAGADVATIPFDVYNKILWHPLTDRGVELFLKDYAKIPNQA